jgi:hypothetical protein
MTRLARVRLPVCPVLVPSRGFAPSVAAADGPVCGHHDLNVSDLAAFEPFCAGALSTVC